LNKKTLIAVLIIVIVLLSILTINIENSFSNKYFSDGCWYGETKVDISDITLSLNTTEKTLIDNFTTTKLTVNLSISTQANFNWTYQFQILTNTTDNITHFIFSPKSTNFAYKFPRQISRFILTFSINSSNAKIRGMTIFNGSNLLFGTVELLKDGVSPIFHLDWAQSGAQLTYKEGRFVAIAVNDNGWAFQLEFHSYEKCS